MTITFTTKVARVYPNGGASLWREPVRSKGRGRAYALRLSLLAPDEAVRLQEGDHVEVQVEAADPDRVVAARVVKIGVVRAGAFAPA